jgi:hypothetical protein
MTPAQFFYQQQLKRKTLQLESDRMRVARLVERAANAPDKRRFERELTDLDIRLGKVKRGLLYG